MIQHDLMIDVIFLLFFLNVAITGLEGLQRTLQIAAAQVDKSNIVVGRGTIHHLVKTLHLEGRALDPTYLNNIYTTYCDYE